METTFVRSPCPARISCTIDRKKEGVNPAYGSKEIGLKMPSPATLDAVTIPFRSSSVNRPRQPLDDESSHVGRIRASHGETQEFCWRLHLRYGASAIIFNNGISQQPRGKPIGGFLNYRNALPLAPQTSSA